MSEINIFNRNLLRQRRDRASRNISEYDFIFKSVAENILESLDIINNKFPLILNMSDINKQLSKKLEMRRGTEKVILSDISSLMFPQVALDEEFLPFCDGAVDAVVSNLNLQWVNDLPGVLIQVKKILKSNSLFIGALLGGDTLKELRQSLMEAELKVSGGASPRISPFVNSYTMSGLMQRAGFEIPVVDSEIINVKYSSILNIIKDLRGMGATNIINNRLNKFTSKKVFIEADRIYHEKFSDNSEKINASFEVIYFIGWTAQSK